MDKDTIQNYNHSITIVERKSILVTGVKKIESFDDEEFLMETVMGYLILKGSDMELLKLDTMQGNVSIKGLLKSFAYIDEALKKDKNDISRQTIAKYIARLDTLNLISKNTDNYVYYFASGNYRETTTKETYSKAWREYWQNKNNGYTTTDAINEMRYNYGGVARKYPIPEWNGIYLDEINYIIDLVCESIENELNQ